MNYVLTENAVGKIRRAIAPNPGNTGAVGANGRPIDPDMFPAPWTVRWSASANNKQGTWVIWLPDIAQLVMLKDAYITPTGVTAEQALPMGWYTIDDASASSTEVYLNITIPETGTASAEISTAQGQSTTGETVMSVLVAEMAVDAETGAKRVKQYVDSAVVLGGEDGGAPVVPDDVSTEFIPDPPAGTQPDGDKGTQPDGDEGKLQIKDWKDTTVVDANNLSDYLQSVVAIPQNGIQVVARFPQVGDSPLLGYVPLAALDLYEYAKKTDLPTVGNGTLTIKQGTTTLGTFTANQVAGTTVTIPEPPTPPTVNDGILTLNLGSLSKTFSANQAANETITIPAKTIAAGSNVAISVNGNTITISANGGGSTSGFSGTRRTLALTRYDISANQLQAKFFTETWANGLMTASVIDDAWSVIEGGQAVVETV